MDALEKLLQLQIEDEENTFDNESLLEAMDKMRVDPSTDIDDELSCLKVNQSGGSVDLFTLNNFSAVIGPAKARKSFALALAVGSFARGGLVQNKFEGLLKKKALIFDTEQGGKHLIQKLKAIETIAGGYSRVHSYGLRPFSPQKRLGFIKKYLESYGNNYNLVIVDGVRDLMIDINNPTESTKLVSYLMEWTYEKNIHICVVIHTNKEGGYARGHIGTEIMNKSETVIKVSKEGPLTRVVCEYSRGRPFDDFYFDIIDGIPMISDYKEPTF